MIVIESYYNNINNKAVEIRKVNKRYQVIEGFRLSPKLKLMILEAVTTNDYSIALDIYKSLTN